MSPRTNVRKRTDASHAGISKSTAQYRRIPWPSEHRMENCVIVNASGRQLDQLREEASRISRGHKVDWWVERGDKGTRFCFEDAEAKKAFVSFCENFAVQCIEA